VHAGDRRPSGLHEQNKILDYWVSSEYRELEKIFVPNTNKRKGRSEDANEDSNPQGNA
jgi:hypothetical protein